MTTAKQDRDFQAAVIVNVIPNLLGDACAWIVCNLAPEDVFTEEQLSDWAKQNGFVPVDDL